jgi:hypothetical protein
MDEKYFNTIVLNTIAIQAYIQDALDWVVWISEDRINNSIILSVGDGDRRFQKAYSYTELEQIADPLVIAKQFVEDYNNYLLKGE